MKTYFRITILQANSKGVEQIIKSEEFDNRSDLEKYIKEIQIEPKPYRLKKNQKGFMITG